MRSPRLVTRTVLRVGLALLVVLLAADTAGWFWLTRRMMDDVAAWKAARAAEGYVLGSRPPVRGGWPLRAEVTVPDLSLATSAAPEPASARWQIDRVVLRYSLFRPAQLLIALEGQQHVRFGTAPPVEVAARQLAVVVTLSHAGHAVARIEGRDVTLPLAAGPLELGGLSAQFDGMGGTVQASAVALPGISLPFGGVIDSVALTAHSSVPVQPGRDLVQMAAAWRDAGGQLTVDHAALRWGPLRAEGSALFSLDPALQPRGNATLQLIGFAAASDALTRAGIMAHNEAMVANTVLGLMAHRQPDGQQVVVVPLTLDNGRLTMGAIPIARVSAVAWP